MRQFVCVIVTLIGVGSLLLGGCSGGGGSDQLPTRSNTSLAVPSECIAYCTFVCSKVGICNNLSKDDVNTCANTCVNTIEQQGLATGTSCNAAANQAAAASCSQLANLLGLPSAPRAVAVNESVNIPEMFGEAAAITAQQ